MRCDVHEAVASILLHYNLTCLEIMLARKCKWKIKMNWKLKCHFLPFFLIFANKQSL